MGVEASGWAAAQPEPAACAAAFDDAAALDAALVRRIAAGDLDAHRQLYERHGANLLRYLVGRLEGAVTGVAEELLQETMLVAWRQADGFRGDSRVRTWLFGIAHHLAAKHWRRARLEAGHALPDLDIHRLERLGTDTWRQQADLHQDLNQALAALPWEQRAVLDLTFYHGLEEAEVAAVLGIRVGTVKSRLHRAKATLRPQLQDYRKEASHA